MIEYKRGKENIVADAISRRNEDIINTNTEIGELAAISQPILGSLKSIQNEVTSRLSLQELAKRIVDGEALGP